ncbi:MAG: S41 family peptidase [Burkholderiales bacterium]
MKMMIRGARGSHHHRRGARWRLWLGGLALSVLSGCGGYDGNTASCDLVSRQTGLRAYFNDWYFWYALSPYPEPGSLPTIDAYFNALLYTGTDPNFPADRWSFHQSTESFNRFYGAGQLLGYGLFVADLEVAGAPTQPLFVRYVEPQSPAAAAGVTRGDQVVSIDGRPAADMIAANDFSVLSPQAAGTSIQIVLLNNAAQRTVNLTSAVFPLTPVPSSRVVTTSTGKKMGYLAIKDMLGQAGPPLAAAFQDLAAQGITELAIDLRYNAGGLLSVGRDLASYVNPSLTAARTYASLLFNVKRAPLNNSRFLFRSPANALSLTRVYVLQGARTCAASEQVINALRPFVTVVPIGDTSCGKPVGFVPLEGGCGETYAVINFETMNASGEGRYFDGFAPSCAVAEDFTQPMGGDTDPLLVAARNDADGIACPVATAAARERSLAAKVRRWAQGNPEGERGVMIPR